MTDRRPVLVALPFDHETGDILTAAADLAMRFEAPLSVVHALSWHPAETDGAAGGAPRRGRDQVLRHLAPWIDQGADIDEIHVERGRPADVVVRRAQEVHAHAIVTGGGGPATIGRWLFGSTAETIVRSSLLPVLIARGPIPFGHMPVLCPIDLSPQSRVGFTLALRMARLYGTSLRTLTVLPEEASGYLHADALEEELAREEGAAQRQVERFLSAHDLSGVEVTSDVVIGDPATRIVEASNDAGLLVLGSRGFDLLRPGTLGGVTERVLRFARTSALTVRDPDPQRDEREKSLQQVAELWRRGRSLLEAGETDRALALLELATARAPANAAVQESLAEALDAVGRKGEAETRRRLAETIRNSFR